MELTQREVAAKPGVNEQTISRWVNIREAIGGQSEKALRRFVGDMLRDRAPKIDFEPDDIWSMDIAMICKRPLRFEFSLINDEKTEAREELWKQGSGRRAVNA